MNPHVVIIGGGFGGLNVAKALKTAPVRVTLIDRRNFHLFQPLLYQVATGMLSPADIASPLRGVLNRQKNTTVLLAEVKDIDAARHRVILADGEVDYDTLVVATGSQPYYFGHNQWQPWAPGLKTVEDATDIRRRILSAFEQAERELDPEQRRAWLTFVVVGGGPTGVELAGQLAEIAQATLKHDFRTINPPDAQILLIEGAERILLSYPPDLSARAAASLEQLRVEVRTKALVINVEPDAVTIRSSNAEQRIPSHTVLWAAGVQGSPLGRVLAEAAGAELDRSGRVIVQPDLSLPGHPEILVIGDLACYRHQTGQLLPGVAQVAIQQGRYAARLIQRRLRGQSMPPFRYRDPGNMATIGRAAAVVEVGRVHLWGYPAWLAWLFIHLMYLVEHESRLLVFIQWAWYYFTFHRSARLITHP